MTIPVNQEDIPEERLQAKQIIQSTYIPVGNHFYGNINSLSVVQLSVPEDAQFLKLQALSTNIRYRIDGETPNTNIGFQLAAGADVLIPCAVNYIYIIGEGSGTYQGQFVR